MRVTFLGTGTSQGVPVIACQCPVCLSKDPRDKRLRSSIMVETGEKRIIIDCGPDFRQQMLTWRIESLDAIVITHGHKDHIGGLDDVRAFNYILGRPIDVYCAVEVQNDIRREFDYAFQENKYPGVPEIKLHLIENKPFSVEGISVVPIRARHYADEYVFGFRIDDFTYVTDAFEIIPSERKKMAGSKVIVLNALRKKKHYSHFNLAQALEIFDEVKPKQGLLTHISHQMGTSFDVNNELPQNVNLAHDGLILNI